MQSKTFRALAFGAASAIVLLAASAAWAAPVTSFTSDPAVAPGSAAATDDPTVLGKIRNLMRVDVGGNDWTNAQIRIQLTAGTVYNATNAAGTEASPNSALWSIPTLRN